MSIFSFLSDILSTVLTGLSPPLNPTAILAADSILEALGKAQKYFTDFLTNFNGSNQLIQLDSNGHIPKLNGDKITQYETLPVFIQSVIDGTYRIYAYPSAIAETIRWTGIYDLKSDTNAGTLSITIDGTVITGLDTLTINQTGTDYAATGNQDLTSGSDVFIVVSNSDNSSPITNLSFTLYGVKNP